MYPGAATHGLCSPSCVGSWDADRRECPAPDVIRQRAAEISAGWSEGERYSRIARSLISRAPKPGCHVAAHILGPHLQTVADGVRLIDRGGGGGKLTTADQQQRRAIERQERLGESVAEPWQIPTTSARGIDGPLSRFIRER